MRRASFNLPNHAHYLTFSCYRRQELLTDDALCRQLLVSWNDARREGNFAIWAFVVMPEHVHLLIWPRNEEYKMAAILRMLKESFARWVVKYWVSTASENLARIKVRRGGRVVHRFWQEGGGYDRNLYTWESIVKAITYIEWNPVRRGLVTDPADWLWSSARYRVVDKDAPIVVDQIDLMERSDPI